MVATIYVTVAFQIGLLDSSPYTDEVTCQITGRATQGALGDVVVLNIDGTESVKLQTSQCFNIVDVEVGESFTGIMVTDSEGTLQCLVKVK